LDVRHKEFFANEQPRVLRAMMSAVREICPANARPNLLRSQPVCRLAKRLQQEVRSSFAPLSSVPEVADAGEDHRDPQSVGGGDDFLVLDAAAGLDHGSGASRRNGLKAIGEGKEGV